MQIFVVLDIKIIQVNDYRIGSCVKLHSFPGRTLITDVGVCSWKRIRIIAVMQYEPKYTPPLQVTNSNGSNATLATGERDYFKF